MHFVIRGNIYKQVIMSPLSLHNAKFMLMSMLATHQLFNQWRGELLTCGCFLLGVKVEITHHVCISGAFCCISSNSAAACMWMTIISCVTLLEEAWGYFIACIAIINDSI